MRNVLRGQKYACMSLNSNPLDHQVGTVKFSGLHYQIGGIIFPAFETWLICVLIMARISLDRIVSTRRCLEHNLLIQTSVAKRVSILSPTRVSDILCLHGWPSAGGQWESPSFRQPINLTYPPKTLVPSCFWKLPLTCITLKGARHTL